jgi:hypothetical protein
MARAIDARRLIERRRRGGRAWVNGSELGRGRPALAYLGEIYD